MIRILLEDIDIPTAGTWKWKKNDYKKGISFKIGSTKVRYYILEPYRFGKEKLNDREIFHRGRIKLEISSPEPDFLKGLQEPESKFAVKAADEIYKLYQEACNEALVYIRWLTGIKFVLDSKTSYHEMFDGRLSSLISEKSHVLWKNTGDSAYISFKPKLPKKRGIHSLFKAENLLSREKWARLRKKIPLQPKISAEIRELIRIEGEAIFDRKKISAIETCALMEVILSNKIRGCLVNRGQVKGKIDDQMKESGLSALLNSFLLLVLTKSEFSSISSIINDIDSLRKIRNKVAHENLIESKIDGPTVKRAIASSIKLVLFLERKFP